MSSSEISGVTKLGRLDLALSLSIGGGHEAALAVAAQLLDVAPANAAALFVVARSLGDLGQAELSRETFELAIQRALRAGNFPLALAAACELRQAGIDPSLELKQIADVFAKGSAELSDHRAPPDMALPTAPNPEFRERGAALVSRVTAVIERSKELLADEAKTPLLVPPQVLFSQLDSEALFALVRAFEELTVDTGHVLMEQGMQGSEAYILARGELEVQRLARDGKARPMALARLGAGALFGEMSLLSRSPRAASVVACRPSIVLKIAKKDLDEVAKAQPSVAQVLAQFTRQRMIDNLVRTSSILSAVHPSERSALLERFVTRTFESGDKVITQGQESLGLHLVASGSLSVIRRDDDDELAIKKLGPGEVVGEVALVLRRPSNADVIAEHPTVTLHLPREEFLDLIKAYPEVLTKLYELAVERDEETRSLVAQEATDADEFVLL